MRLTTVTSPVRRLASSAATRNSPRLKEEEPIWYILLNIRAQLEHSANMDSENEISPGTDPATTAIVVGKDGPQVMRFTAKRWNEEAETVFLDTLAATCNVTAAAAACGFSDRAVYYRRRNDPGFAKRWQAALETGYVRIETLLIRRAIEALEGFAPDPSVPIAPMTVKEASELLGRHRAAVEGGSRSRRYWARPRSLDEIEDSILRKLEAVAPTSPLPQAEGEIDEA